ncbi:MAG: hypothetical protein CEN89_129 [Candidatus Berkelbacteria bacterium Licking1014_7]|uniref:Uncharacterized protein n=1 Tax=Candidatus Berkelbacteria bacterium Licking1014_7 TaxID=2017147 RepID=A0A554LKE2_9BACT|nr:MAG: hypothetical protein CEN89_129 [Candidatus Berkelbacteria bacterium Licking1014_7]
MESIIKPTKRLIGLLKNTNDLVDLSNFHFIYPIELLPMASLISEKSLEYIKPVDKNCQGYMKYFDFPNGLTRFSPKSHRFIQIYKFSASKADKRSLLDKSEILKNLIEICLSNIGSPRGAVSALNLAVDEIISNVEDHSEAKYGWINTQYYPKKDFLDMCILDRGITIAGKYKKVGKGFGSDLEALKNALEGESSKPEKIRGSGLPTFTNLITQAFDGEMIIISGNAIVYANKKSGPIVNKISVKWDGTIVAFRIPKNLESIDYTQYIDQ